MMPDRPRVFRDQVVPSDPAAIVDLVRATGVFNQEEIEIARTLAEEALERGTAAGYFFLFADSASAIDAYTCFGAIPGTDARFELYWIAVAPSAQGRGLASALLQATEERVFAMGARHLYAETSGLAVYVPAHRLYRARGFDLKARVEDYHADGDDLLIFGKVLRTG
jgi:ribosomal protein S18 acetylase RimI-like enzyme